MILDERKRENEREREREKRERERIRKRKINQMIYACQDETRSSKTNGGSASHFHPFDGNDVFV